MAPPEFSDLVWPCCPNVLGQDGHQEYGGVDIIMICGSLVWSELKHWSEMTRVQVYTKTKQKKNQQKLQLKWQQSMEKNKTENSFEENADGNH